jgi:ribose 5-phosphate isomerase B
MNLLCLGSEIIGPSVARELVAIFLDARFDGGERYVARLEKVAAMEKEMKSGEVETATAG